MYCNCSKQKVINLEKDGYLLEFLEESSIGIYKLEHNYYDIPNNFISGDMYRDRKVCIFIESDSYIKSDFITLSLSKPRFYKASTNTLYIGLKDFIGTLIRGEEFLFFELVNSWDMKNHELFNYIYKYNEWLFCGALISNLINRIKERKLNNKDILCSNDKWNGIVDLIQLTFLLNDTKRNVFKLNIGELELGSLKLKDYKDKDESEDSLNYLLDSLLNGMDEYERRLDNKIKAGAFLNNEDRISYLSRSMFYINEMLQEYLYLDKFLTCKFPLLKGSCELQV